MNALDLSFINAQQMHKENPESFYAPDETELENLNPNDFVKIGVRIFDKECSCDCERFWLEVIRIEDGVIHARVDNQLVFTEYHNVACHDELIVSPHHVMNILLGERHECAN